MTDLYGLRYTQRAAELLATRGGVNVTGLQPAVTYYQDCFMADDGRFDSDWPWLPMINNELKTSDGIERYLAMVSDPGFDMADWIVALLDNDRARDAFDGRPLPEEFAERLRWEAILTMRLALKCGAAHMFVRRGRVAKIEDVTTKAQSVRGLCVIIVDMPYVDHDGRCLPEDA